MEDSSPGFRDEPQEQAEEINYFQAPEPQVWMVLLGLLAACLVFSMVGAGLFQGIALLAGWDTSLLYGNLTPDAPPAERWQMRLLLAISHTFTFLLAGWATLRYFYPPNSKTLSYLLADRKPEPRTVLMGIVLILAAIPLVLYTYNLNQALPIPESMRMMEEQAADAIKGLLQMDNGLELLANLILIALLPAVGEELVFRGLVQKQLMRRMGPWAAIILGAAIFSFIHLQFEGFLPRMLLGVLLGWLYWHSQNIWVPIAAHFVNNGIQVFGQFLYSSELSTVDLEKDIEVHWAAAAVSAVVIFFIMSKKWVNLSPKITLPR